MKAKEFIPASKPRNFVAKNQKTAGAGAHKDKKKAAKQGDVKHKGKVEEYGDTAKGQKMLSKVQKRAVDRMIKADDKRDAKDAKKNQQTANRAWDRMDTSEGTTMEGRHGYDDFGMSLAPGHDEGEPVYNPYHDRTARYGRASNRSQDLDYKSGRPISGAGSREKKGFVFYNVNDPDLASQVGLKQTKSGKWYAFTTDRFLNKSAEREFGPGKVWYPKD